MEEIKTIEESINALRKAESPHVIADLRLELAGWKTWLGSRLVDAEMIYNGELNRVMTEQDLPAAKAKIMKNAGDKYKEYARFKQLYKDVQTVIGAARSKLMVLEEERRTYN